MVRYMIVYNHNKKDYTMKNLPRIYLDMDGVLVNFEKQLEDTIKMPISKWMKLDRKARWDPVIARKDFWSSMLGYER